VEQMVRWVVIRVRRECEVIEGEDIAG